MAAAEPALLPKIHAAGVEGDTAYLVTDYKDLGSLSPASQVKLGTLLARMHQNGTSPDERFGFHVPTHCGATEQDNTRESSWRTFFVDRRLGDLIDRIGDPELTKLHGRLRERAYDLLFENIDPPVQPSILHGDLWRGNVGSDRATGEPIIFDPSSYYGHNEMEFGIMHMFSGFNSAFFDAYHAVLPRSKGPYEQRIALYEVRPHSGDCAEGHQAYHHLNHTLIFGHV